MSFFTDNAPKKLGELDIMPGKNKGFLDQGKEANGL